MALLKKIGFLVSLGAVSTLFLSDLDSFGMANRRAERARWEQQHLERFPPRSTEYGRIYAQLDRACVTNLMRAWRPGSHTYENIYPAARDHCRLKRSERPGTGIRLSLAQHILEKRQLTSRFEAERELNRLVARMTHFISKWDEFVRSCKNLTSIEQAGCRYRLKKFPNALRTFFIPQIENSLETYRAQFNRMQMEDSDGIFDRYQNFRSSVDSVIERLESQLGLREGDAP